MGFRRPSCSRPCRDDIVSNVELDSLISVTLAAGSYTIEATTYDVGETGAFTLTLTP